MSKINSFLALFFLSTNLLILKAEDEVDKKGKIKKIIVWDRESQRDIVEDVAGGWLIRNFAGTKFGSHVASKSGADLSNLMADLNYKKPSSAEKIEEYIKKYKIIMTDFVIPNPKMPKTLGYKNFNDFFIRKLKPRVREFKYPQRFANPNVMVAIADARYLGFAKWNSNMKVEAKGHMVNVPEILGLRDGNDPLAKKFEGGPMVIVRLAPIDYHRFHFPANGVVNRAFPIEGALDSVSPLALSRKPDILFKNKRVVNLLTTEHFGELAYIEIGAVGVGTITHTFPDKSGTPFLKGQEKGYFEFGGSTVVILGEPGKWKPAQDILVKSSTGREVLIKMGDLMAEKF
jgi:phosphatidylserine decarboxylase